MNIQIFELRNLMAENGIDGILCADADDHLSEYTGPHSAAMQFISGFTGGDGTLIVTKEEAGLWTDGRYFIQAAKELEGSGIALMKMGEPGCPDMTAWTCEHLPEGGSFSFDGCTVSARDAEKMRRALRKKKICLVADIDFVGKLWGDRRPMETCEKIRILPLKYAGKSAAEKLSELKDDLLRKGAEGTVLTALDEIAWLLNLRGDDIPCNPVFYSFFLYDITAPLARLYISEGHLTDQVKEYLKEINVEICTDPDRIYEDAGKMAVDAVLLDLSKTSCRMVSAIREGVEILDEISLVEEAKNRKNEVEMANLRIAQKKDSVASVKYMYWFKKHVEEGNLTECSTERKLRAFRAEQEGFLGDSFTTISAYGENAAMCHYESNPERDVKILSKGLYLVDSGGHYPEGSTDITRTWACGPVTEEEKKAYTLVACANLRLADSVFLDRTCGMTLDYPAREILWKNYMNFNHGTGHGVGYLLNVHEGPAGIRYRAGGSHPEADVFTEGVYCSDEPGLYIEGKFGIRLENMLLTVPDHENEFGRFMKFEVLTLVPFDRECMDTKYMTEDDIRLYNEYHERVFKEIAPDLTAEEVIWLKNACRPL